MSPTYTRQNVYELGQDWAAPILWYARGVAAMMARPIDEPTSWRFFAAIHGIDSNLWTALGHLNASDSLPSSRVTTTFWDQCQHGSWYFLPWHRGYLLAIEANIRAAVVQLGGPSDWALPYWNYFKPGQDALPFEFRTTTWPDAGTNPLHVAQRYGPQNDSNVYLPLTDINLDAMGDPDFTGVASGGGPGFGGVDTGFSHGGQVHGALESQPHDQVHGLVGGMDPNDPNTLPGLMSDPDTAALDPIFWLHHANIDRLWAAWNQGPPGRSDPTDSKWLQGPTNVGQRSFSLPMPDGSTWTYIPQQMTELSTLNYEYDDLSPTGVVAPAVADLAASPEGQAATSQGGAAMADGPNVELIGANQGVVTVRGTATTQVRLDPNLRQSVAAHVQARAATASPGSNERVFLNFGERSGTIRCLIVSGLRRGA